MQLIIHIDGGSRGNPGPAAVGVVLHDASNDKLVDEAGIYLGKTTNNVAEYQGLLHALDMAKTHNANKLTIFSDSQLMVRQVNGLYKVKSPALKPLHQQAVAKLSAFDDWQFEHVRREGNVRADELVNLTLDEKADVRAAPSPAGDKRLAASGSLFADTQSVDAFFTVEFTDDPIDCPAKCVSMKKYPFGPGLPADFCVYAAQDLLADKPLGASDVKAMTKPRKCSQCGTKMRVRVDGALD